MNIDRENYIKIGEITIQYGKIKTNNTDPTIINFPVAVKTKVLTIQATAIMNTASNQYVWQPRIMESNLNSFKLSNNATACYWLAIGY